jgi:hypothetical protein
VKSLAAASTRRRITDDWLQQLRELGEYKPLHLVRRVGPLLDGRVATTCIGQRSTFTVFFVPPLWSQCRWSTASRATGPVAPTPFLSFTMRASMLRQQPGSPDKSPWHCRATCVCPRLSRHIAGLRNDQACTSMPTTSMKTWQGYAHGLATTRGQCKSSPKAFQSLASGPRSSCMK